MGHELRFHLFGGLVMDPVVRRLQEAITMTPTDIVHQRRVAAVTHAVTGDNVSETSRVFGVSRKTIHQWKKLAETYGMEALRPKDRRVPQMPNATPTWVIDKLLQLAVLEPTRGARHFADRLGDDGYAISKSGVQNLLNRHGFGRRSQRVAAAAQLALFTEGLVTDAGIDSLEDRHAGPFGFCLWAGAPGALVGLDCFYIGKLKGVGEVWQLTAVDTHSRIADVWITVGRPTAVVTARFVDLVRRRWRTRGYEVTRFLTDNGGEFTGRRFTGRLEDLGITHQRIPPRSPNHNAVVERFHQTMLEECWRPAFHRRLFTSIHQLQAQANAWLGDYNTIRPNHGNWMAGRIPTQLLNNKP
jgi:transposase InsO family protein